MNNQDLEAMGITQEVKSEFNINNNKILKKQMKQEKKDKAKMLHYGIVEENEVTQNMKYEYMIKSFIDEDNGETDPLMLEKLINNYARQGWRLKQIYTNELGKNSTGVGIGGIGSQVNSTIERTFIIFEREIVLNPIFNINK